MSKDKPSWRKDLEASALKQEHIQKCENAVPLVPEVPIMKGQLTYWYGFPGCGKTAAAMELAELASAAGYEVGSHCIPFLQKVSTWGRSRRQLGLWLCKGPRKN